MAATGWSPSGSTYNRKTGRLVASGNVEIVDSNGTKIYSDEIDITDDFADGFVNALRVETIDKTYFAAESAERSAGMLTTFNNGVYTACEPCEDKPDRAPIWRIKAQKIIWNGKAKTVRFENSRFEFFGMPIAYLPVFEIADPTVKRKSGFLIPGISYKSDLGVGVSVPYYFALSPTYDLTRRRPLLSKQGFLGEAEWRQRFNNGYYNLKIAGIDQQDPEAFDLSTRRIAARPATPTTCAAWSAARACSTSIRAGRSAGTCLSQIRQEFLEHLWHRRLRRRRAPLGGLSDRPQRPQLFRPSRHALRRPGRPARQQSLRTATTSSPGCCRRSTIPIRRTSRSPAAS